MTDGEPFPELVNTSESFGDQMPADDTTPAQAAVILDDGTIDEDSVEGLPVGSTVVFGPEHILHVVGRDEVEELSIEEHPDSVEVASVHGRPLPGEADLDDTGFFMGHVWRLGHLWFWVEHDPRSVEVLSEARNDREAVEMACGADYRAPGWAGLD